MKKIKNNFIIIVLILILILVVMLSISQGEIDISFSESLKALLNKSTSFNNNVVNKIRLPRVVVGICVGVALSLSGLITSVALKNPLADSGILGIQSGATIGALIAILVLPSMIIYLPIFSFIGGIVVFLLLLLITVGKNGYSSKNIVLSGVAMNAFATSITGTIAIVYADRFKNALGWLNGSLSTISVTDMKVILIYTTILVIIILFFIPVIKILMLDDNAILNIGHNPNVLRFILTLLAVLLACISVAFVGVIAFIGIIAPQISRKLVGVNIGYLIVSSILIGAILVVGTDLLQRIIFSPMEVPVGILIGVIGAPMFIILARRKS